MMDQLETGKVGPLPVSINSAQLQQLKADIAMLAQGKPPPGWRHVPTLSTAAVYVHKSPPAVYCKLFPKVTFKDRLFSYLPLSPIAQARRCQNQLNKLGFRTPRILCTGRLPTHTYLITEAIEAPTLVAYIAEYVRQPLNTDTLKLKRHILRELGHTVARLHGQGIRHGDLNSGNILVDNTTRPVSFYFLDNEHNRRILLQKRRHVERNLIQLNSFDRAGITNTDRLRFMNSYLTTLREEFSVEFPDLKKSVARLSQKRKQTQHEKAQRA